MEDRAVTRMWQRRVEQMIVLNQFAAFRCWVFNHLCKFDFSFNVKIVGLVLL
jgi:hypothetical protein